MFPLSQCPLNAHYVLGMVADAENTHTVVNEAENILFLRGTFIKVKI